MTLPRIKTESVKTLTRSITLTDEHVENILRDWAHRNHALSNAKVEIDCGRGYLGDTVISSTTEEVEES